MINEKKVIALFDFDGTITTKDSLGAFLLFNFGLARCVLVFIIYLPVHMLFKTGIINSTAAKNFLLPFFLRNRSVFEFSRICDEFCKKKLPGMLNKKALEKIQWHLQNGHEVVIVSASLQNWIQPWALSAGITKCICSRAEITANKLTGKLDGKNCNDEEKVVRIKMEIPAINQYEVYAYGNSKNDRLMLSLADKAFYKKF